jgi:hypothetical protein
MAELVRDDALQLVTLEPLERAARHGNRSIGARAAGGEGVDGRFLLEDIDFGNRRAGGERHLLDDVHEAPLERIVAFSGDARAAERARHVPAAARQHRSAIQAGQCHEPERSRRNAEHEPAMAVEPLFPAFGAEE